MKYIVSLLIIIFLHLIYPKSAQAIIFLPALILIPIAKIIGILIAFFSVPATGLGVLWAKLSRRPILKTVLLSILVLLFLALFMGLLLKIVNPNRPFI